jgi:ubiquinone/menaquinone biosynthesis C-methylase UbiE
LITKKGYSNFDLKESEARHLLFSDETFDVLYNSYMLDLIPIADFPVVLKEFQRVLRANWQLGSGLFCWACPAKGSAF